MKELLLCCCLAISLTSIWASAAKGDEPKRPNILFCIASGWGQHAGAYGTAWVKTPSFDRVAREGLLFQNAYTPNATSAPSRACLLTGRNPWQLKAAANSVCYFPPEFKGWGEVLSDHGWLVGFTEMDLEWSIADDAAGKRRAMLGSQFNKHSVRPLTRGISTNDYAANFEDFLIQTKNEQPWCFWFGSREPRRDYQFDYEYGSGVKLGGKQLADIDHVPAYWPDCDEVRHDMLDYAFEVEHFDRHLGRMLALLEQHGELDNTLIVVTSDHGPPFPRGNANTYELGNHVPLAIMWKAGIAAPGRTIEDFVSFIDFAPTLLDIAGIDWNPSGMAASPGRSLTDIFRSQKAGQVDPERTFALLGRERNQVGRPRDEGYPTRGIVQKDWLYLENIAAERWPAGNPETGYLDCEGGPTKRVILEAHRKNPNDPCWELCFGRRKQVELYHRSTDLDCVKNLQGEASTKDIQTQLNEQLTMLLREQGDPRITHQEKDFDLYPYTTKGRRHFFERYMDGEDMRSIWFKPSEIPPRTSLQLITADKHPGKAETLRSSPEGEFTLRMDGPIAQMISAKDQQPHGKQMNSSYVHEIGGDRRFQFTCWTFMPDGKYVVTGSGYYKRSGSKGGAPDDDVGCIEVWDAQTGAKIGRLDKPRELGTILSLAIAADGNTIVYTAKPHSVESK